MDRIERLMAEWEPKVRDAFIECFKAIRDAASIRQITALLKAGDIEGAIRAVGMDPAQFRALDLILERMFEAGGIDASSAIKVVRGPLGLRIAPLFDLRAPRVTTWLRDHTTDLIRQITDDQRLLIRQALAPLATGLDPMLTGDTPQKLALDLVGRVSAVTGRREGGLLGLTTQQATWARNYEIELGDVEAKAAPDANALTRKLRDKRFDRTVAKAIRDGQPIPEKTREAMVAAYRNRALRYRAETIALNEASTGLHASQIEAWDQAIERGAAVETKVRRFWITAGDDHVRRMHAAVPGMNKDGVRLHGMFETPKGPTMQPGWQFDPGCRCGVRVRIVEPVGQG
jgi:hypothetical protein